MKWIGLIILALICIAYYDSIFVSKENEVQYEYYETGELKIAMPLKDNKPHGQGVLFSKEGDTLVIFQYLHGLKNGIEIHYLSDGFEKRFYKRDTIQWLRVYNENANLVFFQLFKYGIVTHEFHYDSLGAIINPKPFISFQPPEDSFVYGVENKVDVYVLNFDTNSQIDFELYRTLKLKDSVSREKLIFDYKINNTGRITIIPQKQGKYFMTAVIKEDFPEEITSISQGDTSFKQTSIKTWYTFDVYFKD
ncbi:MAG: hypothetical protein A2W91_05390 [Bacteroidetes bacterium GWF2_38_335]|nr:MAG: hypothetical protein A2W91_05390 [Bacteroidetes bacterium GWF2_38_335]HBS88123.1 hypothetical protein [Bacteroidales bacterium]